MTRPNGARAVMASRVEPIESLEYFPTPPWATRALLRHVIAGAGGVAWEPATGGGHMATVLEETFATVHRSDVHDYGSRLDAVGSFVGCGPDVVPTPRPRPDWVITNPPFNLAVDFAHRGLREARNGVALLLRLQWLEGLERWETVFKPLPPSIVAPFVERVNLAKGVWDPDGGTATAYAWFVWIKSRAANETVLRWIPPGCRIALEARDDRRRFGPPAGAMPLFEGAVA